MNEHICRRLMLFESPAPGILGSRQLHRRRTPSPSLTHHQTYCHGVYTERGNVGCTYSRRFSAHGTYYGGLPGQELCLRLCSEYSLRETLCHSHAALQGCWTLTSFNRGAISAMLLGTLKCVPRHSIYLLGLPSPRMIWGAVNSRQVCPHHPEVYK